MLFTLSSFRDTLIFMKGTSKRLERVNKAPKPQPKTQTNHTSKKKHMKNYIQKNGYELKVEVGYEKGGMNYFSGQESRRGYYLYVYPVQRETIDGRVIVESFVMFKGGKKLLLEVTRQSEKAYKQACSMLEANQDFIDRIDAKTQNQN